MLIKVVHYLRCFIFYLRHLGLFIHHEYFRVTGLDLRGGGPQPGAVPAPDHLVAGAIALVPAPTPPDRPVCSPDTVFFV